MSSNKYLLLIWKDPITRRNFTIGKLCHGQTFTFEYCGDFDEAENFGWRKLNAFPEEKTYTSATRLNNNRNNNYYRNIS